MNDLYLAILNVNLDIKYEWWVTPLKIYTFFKHNSSVVHVNDTSFSSGGLLLKKKIVRNSEIQEKVFMKYIFFGQDDKKTYYLITKYGRFWKKIHSVYTNELEHVIEIKI